MTEQLWAPVEGKYGRTRGGQKVGPMSSHGSSGTYTCYGFCGSVVIWYAGNGRTVSGTPDRESWFDLVAEWRDEPQPTLTNTQRLNEPLDGRPLEPSDPRATPDLSDLREGDVVHVRMRVRVPRKNGPKVYSASLRAEEYNSIYVDPTDIVHREPRPPEPPKTGDTVIGINVPESRGTVRHVIDDQAWVNWGGFESVMALADLRPAERRP